MSEDTTAPLAVVTGASRGIGRATAEELASRGFDVVVHTRASEAEAQEVVKAIESVRRRAWMVMADLNDAVQRDRLVDRCWQYGAVDVWVNNAGANVLTGAAAAWPLERKMDQLWAVDVKGTFFLSRQVGALMRGAGRGVIINIGWDQVAHGMAGDSGELFATTKGAIMAFTRSLAQSLAPQVRVNCVAPGWIKTTWGDQASDSWQRRAAAESLAGRWGTPRDVARVVGFLSSPDGGFVSGQTVAVNGGFRYGVQD